MGECPTNKNQERQHAVAYNTFNTDTQKNYKVLLTPSVVGCIRHLMPYNNKNGKSSEKELYVVIFISSALYAAWFFPEKSEK